MHNDDLQTLLYVRQKIYRSGGLSIYIPMQRNTRMSQWMFEGQGLPTAPQDLMPIGVGLSPETWGRQGKIW